MKKYIFYVLLCLIAATKVRAQAVLINSPNGGSIWSSGTKQMITWTASNMNAVRIDFSSDNGQNWQTIAASVPANIGKYEWLVPETPSLQCFIKVTDLEDGSIFSTNQLPFKIPVPTLTVEPLPADLYANTVHMIRWKSESVSRINIYFASVDGPWKAIAENADAQLGYFNWAVSDSLPAIRIKVASASDTSFNVVEGVVSVGSLPGGNVSKFKGGGFDGHSMRSNRPPELQVTSPLAGQTYFSNMVVPVKWKSSGVDFVHIGFSSDSGATWQDVRTLPANIRTYSWELPAVLSDKCLFRISDTAYPSQYFALSPVFSIAPQTLAIFEKPGQKVVAGGAFAIRWEYQGVTAVDIYYNGDGSVNWHQLAANINAENGQYPIVVPDSLENMYFKVVSVSAGGASAESQYPVRVMVRPTVNAAKYRGGSFDGGDMSLNQGGYARLQNPVKATVAAPGSTLLITWMTMGIEKVNIEFTADSGQNWQPIASDIPAAVNQYQWSVPNLPTSKAKIRLLNADNNEVIANSDSLFRIQDRTLTFVGPAKDVSIHKNFPLPVSWTQMNVDTLEISYSADNGNTWNTIAPKVGAVAGCFNWSVDGPVNVPLKLMIKSIVPVGLADTLDASVTILSDLVVNTSKYKGGVYDGHALRSNITMLQLRSPVGGEVMRVGNTFNITWEANNMQDSVIIELSTDGGLTWREVVQAPAMQETYSWLIQEEYLRRGTVSNAREIPPDMNDKCQLRIRGMREESDALATVLQNFTIVSRSVQPSITVLKPATGDTVKAGEGYTIKWASAGITGDVSVAASVDSGLTWQMLADNIANSGSYNWSVPADLSTTALHGKGFVRVYTAHIADTGNAFVWTQLPPPSITVLKPVAHDTVKAGEGYTIRWASAGISGNVSIAASVDSGLTWQTLAESIANNGQYLWAVPERLSYLTPKGKGFIRVYAGNVTDTGSAFLWEQNVVTAIENVNSSVQLKVFPNPTSRYITLQADFINSESFVLQLLDMKGNLKYERKFERAYRLWSHTIDVQGMSAGMMILRMQLIGKPPITVPVVIIK